MLNLHMSAAGGNVAGSELSANPGHIDNDGVPKRMVDINSNAAKEFFLSSF